MKALRRWVHRGAGAAIASIVFAGTAAAALVAHGNLPATKRFVADVTTRALAPLFSGRIVVRDIEHLDFAGVDITEAEVLDPWGRRVIGAKGIHVRAAVPRIFWSLVSSPVGLSMRIDRVDIDEADVLLDPGPSGQNRIAAAFTPPPKPPSKGPPTPSAPRRLEIAMPTISIGRVHAFGEPAVGVTVDAWGTKVPARVLVSSTKGVEIDVFRFGLGAYLLAPLNPQGTADYHLRVPFAAPAVPQMWTSFAGRVGTVPVTASATLTGQVLDAWLDAAKVTPEEARSLVPKLPLADTVSLHVGAKGPLTDLAIDVRAVTGPGEIKVSGNLHTDPLRADARVNVRDLDPRSFDPRAPGASVGGDADVGIAFEDGKLVVDVDGITAPLTVRGEFVPGAEVKARAKDGFVTGTATLFEPGMPTKAKFSIEPGGVYNLEADVTADELGLAPRLRGKVQGKAHATATARMDGGGVEVKFDARGTNVGAGGSRAGALHAYGRLAGPLDKLYLDAKADVAGLLLSGVKVSSATLRAAGPPRSPHVTASLKDPRWDELSLGGTVSFGAGVKVAGLTGKLSKGEAFTDFRASAIDATPGAIAVRGIEIALSAKATPDAKERSPAGRATGSLVISNGGLRGDLVGQVELAKASSLTSLPFTGGRASFAVHMAEGDGKTGTVQVDWKDATIFPSTFLLSGSLRAGIDHGATTGTAELTIRDEDRDVGAARASFKGDLAGPLLVPKSWTQATGSVTLEDSTLDVGAVLQNKLVAVAATRVKNLPRLTGLLHAKGTVERKDGSSLPDVDLTVGTERLDVAFVGDLAKSLPATFRHVHGLDAQATLRATSRDGGDEKTMSLGLKVADAADKTSDFAQAYLETKGGSRRALADLFALFSDKEAEVAEARAHVAAMPVSGRGSLSKRELGAFPDILRVPGAAGSVFASAVVTGTFGRPALGAMAHVDGLRADVPGLEAKPLTGDLSVRLDGEQATVGIALATAERRVVEGKAVTRISTSDLLAGRYATAWSTDVNLTFDGLAVDSLPLLAANGFGGTLHGSVSAKGLHGDPRIDVDLRVEKGTLFGADAERVTLGGFLSSGAGVLTAAVFQPRQGTGGEQGKAFVTLLPAVRFKDGLLPTWDPTRGQTLAIQTSRLDIEPFAQFTAPFLADLRGVVDGELTLTVSPRKPKGGFDTDLWGKLELARGVVIIPQLGQTFTGGKLKAEAREGVDGRTVVAVTDVAFLATSGRIEGSAELSFPTAGVAALLYADEVTQPVVFDAHAKVEVKKEQKIPVTFEGVPLGDAHGIVETTLHHEKGTTEIWVAVPRLVFDLPEAEARGLQKLAELPDVGVVDRRYREGRKRREDAARKIVVRLGIADTLADLLEQRPGPAGQVSVRRAGLDVQLAGRPVVELGETLRMDGDIETLSGRVTALGKPFVVERGYVRFAGEAIDNPYLGLRARWDSPDGARISAELDGYLKPEPKLVFRSDPPKAESEIFGLLLFGRSTTTATTSQNAAEGVAVGTGVASNVLNTLLDPVEVFGRRIETRVDTTTSRGTSLGVATEIRPRLWAQVDVYTGSQQNRQNTDLSALTLDWRFRQDWSLRTTVGDRGSSTLELLWTHRY